MVDNRSPESRSALMSRVKGKDTLPELVVRRLLHRLGYRFRLHRKALPGTPDIVFPSRKKVIFVHGCFWHAHGCPKGRPPKSRSEFWAAKFDRNRKRDQENQAALSNEGWVSETIWQCEIADLPGLERRLVAFLSDQKNDRQSRKFSL
jgi:DNA mismatch endonuclease (patch repair protein)